VRALLVEDNPVDRKLLRVLLEAEGHEVVACSDAGGALDLMSSQRPDVVLVDLNLPDRSGLELVRDLRAQGATHSLPVLAMTAYPHRYTFREVVDAGCSAWLIKPLDTRSLIAQLNALYRPGERLGQS
jgi:DNA-binding response OmpR family regulator